MYSSDSAYAWLEQTLHKHNFQRNAFFYNIIPVCYLHSNGKDSPNPGSGAAIV